MSAASTEWSDAELMARMRREEAAAFREYFLRFHALLVREARRIGVQTALRHEVVDDCMGDVALELIEPNATLPISLPAYLLAALRHKVSNERRGQGRRERRDASAGDDMAGTGKAVVREATSESTLQASDGASHDAAPLPPTIERLATALDTKLSDEDRTLLAWLGEWVPQTTIAAWLGISFGAARVRVHRLRDRLRTAALKYAAGLNADERQQLDRFLERSTREKKNKDPQTLDPPTKATWKGSLRRRAENTEEKEPR